MLAFLQRLVDTVTSAQFIVTCVWVGFALVSIALLVLMQTRWGQSQPLRKCIVLSLIAHLLLVAYATTVRVITGPPQGPYGPGIRVVTIDEDAQGRDPASRDTSDSATPWEDLAADALTEPDVPAPEPIVESMPVDEPPAADIAVDKTDLPAPESPADIAAQAKSPPAVPAEPIETQVAQQQAPPMVAPPAPELAAPSVDAPPQASVDAASQESAASEQIADDATAIPAIDDAARRTPAAIESRDPEGAAPLVPIRPRPAPAPKTAALANSSQSSSPQPLEAGSPKDAGAPGSPPVTGPMTTPHLYQLRTAPDRAAVAGSRGGSPETEAAVRSALKWLAANQSPDGHWDSSRFGGGRETKTLGHDRRGAGAEADTAMTGLALLTFMGAGHTQRSGDYQAVVQRGLDYLIRIQAADGNLAGKAEVYAFMYCHGMAAMALSEALAMTADQRLSQPVRRAINYTLAAQNPTTGGWRYRPHEEGDTSQLGWQLMALKSAELAGVRTPVATRDGMVRFLRSVAAGNHGGLASYRRGELPTRPMTAEALVCRIFISANSDAQARGEAADFVLDERPGDGPANYYYWYYATLAMYQLQDDHWRRWNEALSTTLVQSQRRDADLAGSWDPDTIWGGYGGRVYSTTLAALCLEVYYRYLPLHAEVAGKPREQR